MVASLTTPFTLFTLNIYINIFCVLEKLSLHIGSQKISMRKYPIFTHLSTILTRALTVLILRSICTKHTLRFDGIIFIPLKGYYSWEITVDISYLTKKSRYPKQTTVWGYQRSDGVIDASSTRHLTKLLPDRPDRFESLS